jgi:uncharacterized protein
MTSQSAGTHEPLEKLETLTVDLHRALRSLMEELEAVDWYQQRVDATDDADLKRVLAHNRDEEIEHAAMVLEWIRRNNSTFDRMLRAYLFTEGEITGIEAETGVAADPPAPAGEAAPATHDAPPGLTVGSLIARRQP